ncbi:MAG: MarR family transcriptional regulator [Lachnospiraceae bacterium]|nr:MarR family transcriptional regulator [Lachnospiraceae bacterium]
MNVSEINGYLVKIFNDVLTLEEAELQNAAFKDLSVKEMHTIDAIGLHETKTSTEVARGLMITVGTLTVAINNLVKKGYVERIRSEKDRRIVRLSLTKTGKLVYRVHNYFHEKMVKEVIKDMNEDETAVLLKALTKLHSFLENLKED